MSEHNNADTVFGLYVGRARGAPEPSLEEKIDSLLAKLKAAEEEIEQLRARCEVAESELERIVYSDDPIPQRICRLCGKLKSQGHWYDCPAAEQEE